MMLRLGFKRWLRGKKKQNLSKGMGLPDASDDKESTCNVGDLALIPGLGRAPGEEHGNPLQYSCLENPMNRGGRQNAVDGFAKSQIWLTSKYNNNLRE